MPIKEKTVRAEALFELSQTKSGRLTTSQLIARLSKRLSPSGKDADIALNRSDTYFSQKVRNIVSHRNQSTGLSARGLATYDADTESWTITTKGQDFVASDLTP